ncbi:MAG: hypothetical protein LBF88_10040 [Planctomycetaceae bacterium]|jgi:hypothetical protein|nr:hypothetical protein [Planctomycetaceae bacterium]
MPAWIHITKGTVPENLFDIVSSFSKVGGDLDGNICIPLENIPPCAFILEYNATQQIYYIIPRSDHVLRYEGAPLNRGAKTEWIPGTILEIADELELELEVDENPEPVAALTIVERRSQEIEQSEAEEQSGELNDNANIAKGKSESAVSVSPIYLIIFVAVLSALILPFFSKPSRGTPPFNPTKKDSESVKNIFLNEIKENPLQAEYELWFQWFKEAIIEENHSNYKNASKNYKKIRDNIYDYWKRTGQSEKIQKIVQAQEKEESDDENENNADDLERICDFTVKKIKYLQWRLEAEK